jgi:hypothetical protein
MLLSVLSMPTTLLLVVALHLVALPLPAHAGVDEGFQMWTAVYLDAPIVKRKIRGYLEVNPRHSDDIEEINQLVRRPAIGYRFNQHVSAFGGYAWITNYTRDSLLQEQRVWQQVGYGFRALPKPI